MEPRPFNMRNGSAKTVIDFLSDLQKGSLISSTDIAAMLDKPSKQVQGLLKWAVHRGALEFVRRGNVSYYGLPGSVPPDELRAANANLQSRKQAIDINAEDDDDMLKPFVHRLVNAADHPMPFTEAPISVFHLASGGSHASL